MAEETATSIRSYEEMIQVVLLAIPKETAAYEFYLNAAKRATSDEACELFESLARQEKGHEASLRKILERLKMELREIKKS